MQAIAYPRRLFTISPYLMRLTHRSFASFDSFTFRWRAARHPQNHPWIPHFRLQSTLIYHGHRHTDATLRHAYTERVRLALPGTHGTSNRISV